MNLATRIATAMSTGALERLPRLTRHASPEAARALLEGLYRLQDLAADASADSQQPFTLEDRIAMAAVRVKVNEAIGATHAWLRRCARHGGMGTPP